MLSVVIASIAVWWAYEYWVHGTFAAGHAVVAAVYMVLGWQLGKKYDLMKNDAMKDALTGMYNRRFVAELFPKLQALSDRKGKKLVLFVVDVNDFKSINDSYDHEMGDRVLTQVSRILQESVRSSDYVVRWGGDEFLVIAPCTSELGMADMQNRLIRNVEGSPVGSVHVTISVGYSVYPDEGSTFTDLMKVADRKMYSRKKTAPDPRRTIIPRLEPSES